MSVVVVRHGETDLNAARVFQPEATPLSERGKQQARLVGERLKSMRVVKIITSDLARTLETALHIAARLDRPVEVSSTPLLRERSFGDFRGMPIADVMNTPGVELFRGDYTPPGGESWNSFHERAAQAWEYVVAKAKEHIKSAEDVVVVVTHGLVKTSFARKIWNAAPEKPFENTSVSIVSLEAPHGVAKLGCAEHLPAELLDTKPVFGEQKASTTSSTSASARATVTPALASESPPKAKM